MIRSWLDSFFGPAILRYLGVDLPARPTVEFVGDGVTVADDESNNRTTVTIPGGGGGGGSFTAGGDLTGTSSSQTVAKVKGTTITTAGGSLPIGAVLRTTAGGVADWGAINLADADAVGTSILNPNNGGTGFETVDLSGMDGRALVVDAGGLGYAFRVLPGGIIADLSSAQSFTNKTLVSPVIDSPSITGTPHYSVTNGISTVGDIKQVVGSVLVASTSATTVVSYAMSDETFVAFDVIVTCARRTNVTKAGRYKRSVCYRRTGGGAPQIVGAIESGTDQETTSGDDVTFDVSGNTVRVRFTAADTDQRNVKAELRADETNAT